MKQAFSAGARYERAAVLRKVRAMRNNVGAKNVLPVLEELIEWMLTRRRRYEKRPGGL